MTTLAVPERNPEPLSAAPRARWASSWRRAVPTLTAAALAAAYVLASPPSADLAAHLYRAHLFSVAGFALWDNGWYAGSDPIGYSVLFGAVSAALSPQLAAALAATATAALFESLVRRHFGPRALPAAVLFGAATAIDLYTGRLALAFGALPALGAIVALDRRRTVSACGLALTSALCSPVAALFCALAAAGDALGSFGAPHPAALGPPHPPALGARRRASAALPGTAVAAAALAPVAAVALAFGGDGGAEPFELGTLVPVLAICVGALAVTPRSRPRLCAGIVVYALATLAVYLIPSPIGSNIARLGTLLAAPLGALLLWPGGERRSARSRPRAGAALLAALALPLLYVGWQAPVRDTLSAAADPSTSAAYYRPLLRFLAAQHGPPFRVEIPFTASHWEAYEVATRYPLARGWERQLDVADDPLFYRGRLTAAAYDAWLHADAVRFVALPDAALDPSAVAEAQLIRNGLPYLRPVMRSRHWRVYAVARATGITSGAAVLGALGPDWLRLTATAPGPVLVRVRFSAYWALVRGDGCVAPAGRYTRLTLRRAGAVLLATRFSPARIGARSARCTRAAGR